MASEVILVQGTHIRISTTAQTETAPSPLPAWALIDCIGKEIQVQGGTAPEIDVTSICSTAKEFRLGLQDPGSMTIAGHWKQGHPAHTALRTAAADKQLRLVEVEFEDGGIFRALASVQQRSWAASVDGVVTASYTLRLSGATLEIDPT
jgi:predicted secreted protein